MAPTNVVAQRGCTPSNTPLPAVADHPRAALTAFDAVRPVALAGAGSYGFGASWRGTESGVAGTSAALIALARVSKRPMANSAATAANRNTTGSSYWRYPV